MWNRWFIEGMFWGVWGQKRRKNVFTAFPRQYLFYICSPLLSASSRRLRAQGGNKALARFQLGKNDSDRSSEARCLYGGVAEAAPRPLRSSKHFHPPNRGRAKTRQGLLPATAMAPPGEGSQACQMYGGEQETPIRKKSWMTLHCLAWAARQQLTLRNLVILFIFFHHKQVLGSPGWEGHVDKKRKRNHIFFFTCVICSDEPFLPTAPFPGISADALVSPSSPTISRPRTSHIWVTLPGFGDGWHDFGGSSGGTKSFLTEI